MNDSETIKNFDRIITELSDLIRAVKIKNRTSPCIPALQEMKASQDELRKLKIAEKKAGFFSRGGARKKREAQEKECAKKVDKLLKVMLSEYRTIYNELVRNLRTIALIIPEKTALISGIDFPHAHSFNISLPFMNKVSEAYFEVHNTLKADITNLLADNRFTLEKYRKYISIPDEEIPETVRTTTEILLLMGLEELLSLKEKLIVEESFLKQQRNAVERKIQVQIVEIHSLLLKNLETARSFDVTINDEIKAELEAISRDIEGEHETEEYFELERRLDTLVNEFLNLIRKKIISLKTDTESQLGRIETMFEEGEIFPPAQPEIDISTIDPLKLVSHLENMRSWKQKVLIFTKKTADTKELLTLLVNLKKTRGISEVRSDLREEIKELGNQVGKAKTLDEGVDRLKTYVDFRFEICELIRQKMFSLLDNQELQAILKVFPPPPEINSKTNNPQVLLYQFDSLDKWMTGITDYLRRISRDIDEYLIFLEKARSHFQFDLKYKEELQSLRKEIVGDTSLYQMLTLRKNFLNSTADFRQVCLDFIKETLSNPLITKLTLIGAPPMPVLSDLDPERIDSIFVKLEQIHDWKKDLMVYLQDIGPIDNLITKGKLVAQLYSVEILPDYFSELKRLQEKVGNTSEVTLLASYAVTKDRMAEELRSKIRERIRVIITELEESGIVLGGFRELLISESKAESIDHLIQSLEKTYKWIESKTSGLEGEVRIVQDSLLVYKILQDLGVEIPNLLLDELKVFSNAKEGHMGSKSTKSVISSTSELNKLHELQRNLADYTMQKIHQKTQEISNHLIILKSVPTAVSQGETSLDIDKIINFQINHKRLDEAVDILKILKDWDKHIISSIENSLRSLEFPLLPIETQFDLRKERQQVLDKIQEINQTEKALQLFVNFSSKFDRTRSEILDEVKSIRTRIREISDKTRKMEINIQLFDPVSSLENEHSYSEVISEWYNLYRFMTSKTENLLEILEKRVGVIIGDFGGLPEPHGQFFQPMVKFFRDGLSKLKKLDTMEDLLKDYGLIQNESRAVALTCYQDFCQNIVGKLRMSLLRINDVMELPQEYFEQQKKIKGYCQSALTSDQKLSLEDIVRSTRESLSEYDDVVNQLIELALNQATSIVASFQSIRDVGIDIFNHLPSEITDFVEGMKDKKKSLDIRIITDAFSAIDSLRLDKSVCKILRGKASERLNKIRFALKTISEIYEINVEEKLTSVFSLMRDFEINIGENDLFVLMELCLTIDTVRRMVLETIKTFEDSKNEKYNASNYKKFRYYPIIAEIFIRYREQISDLFPYDQLMSAREKLAITEDLDETLDLLPFIKTKRKEMLQNITEINNWHRALKYFKRFKATKSNEENLRQFEDIRKKVDSTYKDPRIRMYLALYIKEFIESQTETKIVLFKEVVK